MNVCKLLHALALVLPPNEARLASPRLHGVLRWCSGPHKDCQAAALDALHAVARVGVLEVSPANSLHFLRARAHRRCAGRQSFCPCFFRRALAMTWLPHWRRACAPGMGWRPAPVTLRVPLPGLYLPHGPRQVCRGASQLVSGLVLDQPSRRGGRPHRLPHPQTRWMHWHMPSRIYCKPTLCFCPAWSLCAVPSYKKPGEQGARLCTLPSSTSCQTLGRHSCLCGLPAMSAVRPSRRGTMQMTHQPNASAQA